MDRVRGGVTDVAGLGARDHASGIVPIQARGSQQHAGRDVRLGAYPELVRLDFERSRVSWTNIRRSPGERPLQGIQVDFVCQSLLGAFQMVQSSASEWRV